MRGTTSAGRSHRGPVTWLGLGSVALILACSALPVAHTAAPPGSSRPSQLAAKTLGAITVRTAAGSGYLVLNDQNGSVASVWDSFRQPSARCVPSNASGSPGDQNVENGPILYAGALDFSTFVAVQLQTEVLCEAFYQNPIYIASYLIYNSSATDPFGVDMAPMVAFPGFVLAPGDTISAKLTTTGGRVTLLLSDVTQKETVAKTLHIPGFQPNGGGCLLEQFGPLARFSGFSQSCHAAVDGTAGGIGAFAAPNVTLRFRLLNYLDQTTLEASPSSLGPDHATYATVWLSSRPDGCAPCATKGGPTVGFAGYLLFGPRSDSVRAAFDSFVQPAARCDSRENATGHSPFDQTVLIGPGLFAGPRNLTHYRFFQVGTQALCSSFYQTPIYSAFYLVADVANPTREHPFAMARIPGLSIHPGDSINASVVSSGDDVIFHLSDVTTHQSVTRVVEAAGFQPTAASCTAQPLLNLARFSMTSNDCNAQVGGTIGGIGSFPGAAALLRFDLRNATGGVQASASPLSSGGAVFDLTWKTSEPLSH